MHVHSTIRFNGESEKGFTKQQLRIQAATGDRKLKITGKSRQGDNKLIRFNKELTVPSVYDLDQIRAKFEGGVLYIKHPKKISVQPCRYRKIMQAQLQRLKSLDVYVDSIGFSKSGFKQQVRNSRSG